VGEGDGVRVCIAPGEADAVGEGDGVSVGVGVGNAARDWLGEGGDGELLTVPNAGLTVQPSRIGANPACFLSKSKVKSYPIIALAPMMAGLLGPFA
jgi:hypothetical protein